MLISLFIITIYLSANLYFYLKLSSVFSLSAPIEVAFALVVTIMTASPVLIPIYKHRGSEWSVRIYSYIGYLWLAFLVPFVPAAALLDIYNLAVVYFAEYSQNMKHLPVIYSELTVIVPCLLSVAINTYGCYEARNLVTERLTIKTDKLPEGVSRIRIAQISDLHLGDIVRDRTVEKVVQIVNKEAPDIIVSTGDLVDGLIRHIEHLPEKLCALEAPYGKYAVMGNHETYGGARHTMQFTEDSGFTLLRDEGITVNNDINIAGLDFAGGESVGYSLKSKKKTAREVLSVFNNGLFTILLKHRSDVDKDSHGLFDLQLSGHTHRGQIFPMHLATKFIFQYHSGFTQLPWGSSIYVSRGTGTSGPPIRFLSKPEVMVIDIVSE